MRGRGFCGGIPRTAPLIPLVAARVPFLPLVLAVTTSGVSPLPFVKNVTGWKFEALGFLLGSLNMILRASHITGSK